MRLFCLLLLAVLPACSSGGGGKNGGTAAAPGFGGSGNAASGGSGAIGSGGVGAAGNGGSGGAGAQGGSGGISVSGSLSVPAGQSIDGVQVIACVPNAAGTDCDTTKSKAVSLTGSGTSASFDLTDLLAEPCYVIAIKDENANGSVDAGDLLGAVLDKDGSLLLVTPPVGNLTISLAQVAAPTGSVPTELVGSWQTLSMDTGIDYTFGADGSWSSTSLYDPSGCLAIDKVSITRDGYVNVQGNQISFNPQTGTYQSFDCSGDVTAKPPSLAPFVDDYTISVDPSTGLQQLTLVDANDPTQSITYTKQ